MKCNLYKAIVGGKIVCMDRACDLISIGIETQNHSKIWLHIQTIMRILHKSKVILSSDDMFRCGLEEKSDNFVWYENMEDSVYDLTLAKISPLLINSRILKVCPKRTKDLFLYLENDLCIQVLVTTVIPREMYRLFDHNHLDDDHEIVVST